ncbi:uncharacterized protein MYCFIDRAFT_177367 [Pseudocercospora fijiensis CIRAD86]|uniref:Uncharacterized protein n=1 Tax=Pseudocercospora fijiensis (strain CIRAD86) TaxID=383855 RepID=M3ATE9_PSEFD|nr:uncharacterized protein MYCFIDRAFT_177367 [Pseudocercospora fijiensis CIRAD86]EME80423.1 hypothetical protein MYCFIDRAFT_177367 [Pseudocercospora fijiensis CIRAD86]
MSRGTSINIVLRSYGKYTFKVCRLRTKLSGQLPSLHKLVSSLSRFLNAFGLQECKSQLDLTLYVLIKHAQLPAIQMKIVSSFPMPVGIINHGASTLLADHHPKRHFFFVSHAYSFNASAMP